MTTPAVEPVVAIPEGYRSAEAKGKFTIGAVIAGICGFLAPMLLPFLMIPVMMVSVLALQSRPGAEIPLRASAEWNGRIWFIANPANGTDTSAGASRFTLKSVGPGEKDQLVREEATLAGSDEPQLLAAGDRLWLISESSLAWYRDGQLTALPAPARRGDLSVPFLLDGKPAVFELQPARHNLLVIENDTWVVRETGRLDFPDESGAMKQLHAVQAGGKLHLVLKCGATIFATEWSAGNQTAPAWTAVIATDSYVDALAVADHPVILYYHGGRLGGLRLEEGGWIGFCDLDLNHSGRNLRVFPGNEPGSAVLVRNENRKLIVTDLTGGAQAREQRNQPLWPKEGAAIAAVVGLIWFLALLAPGAVLVALTWLMKRYRVAEYRIGERTAVFASLLQRGIAAAIDALIFGAPIVAALALLGWKFLRNFSPGTNPPPAAVVLPVLGFLAGGFAFSLVGVAAISWLEGRWGVTPGKWLCRIRVWNLELHPCGFWRALARRLLLMFVDAFCYYLVGMLMVAFMPKWQRVGDLAAGTIVVRKP